MLLLCICLVTSLLIHLCPHFACIYVVTMISVSCRLLCTLFLLLLLLILLLLNNSSFMYVSVSVCLSVFVCLLCFVILFVLFFVISFVYFVFSVYVFSFCLYVLLMFVFVSVIVCFCVPLFAWTFAFGVGGLNRLHIHSIDIHVCNDSYLWWVLLCSQTYTAGQAVLHDLQNNRQ